MAEVTNDSDTNVCTDEKMEEDNINNFNVAKTDAEEDTPKHPYHLRLSEFQPNAWQLEERQLQKYLPLEDTKLTMVDSQELLDEMMTKLKQVKEFAFDLEHHTYHSFMGFVCVVKISTRTEDFIVDAIKLKEEMKILNEVCTDPNILKVFHASYYDILGLQKDFGIYIVNMFDTLEAAKSFNPQCSLTRVLKEHCDIDIGKKYRLDWTVRPLPPDMINHARKDTHYLLYLCDVYTNKCLHSKDSTADVLKTLYERSTKLCGLVYAPPEYKADSYKTDYDKIKGILTSQQLECFRLLHEWRYNTAREQDESTTYTFPTKLMFQLSKRLPDKVQDVSFSKKTFPPLVKQNIKDVFTLVMKAKGSKKSFCLRCRKPGHMTRNCTTKNIYGKSHVDPRRGTFVGGFGNPHGDHRRGSFGNTHGDNKIGSFVGGFGNPNDNFHMGVVGGDFGNSRGDFYGGVYGGDYDSRGFQSIPTPYSSYEGTHPGNHNFPGYQSIPQPSQSYGPRRPRFNYKNPWHPYL